MNVLSLYNLQLTLGKSLNKSRSGTLPPPLRQSPESSHTELEGSPRPDFKVHENDATVLQNHTYGAGLDTLVSSMASGLSHPTAPAMAFLLEFGLPSIAFLEHLFQHHLGVLSREASTSREACDELSV